ncbi:MAG: type II toxin-antitoxin system VapC family toxin [Methanophagales archaeon]|nr:type II toxin-antitoxin system VapC family toxin [Methanophagales archaeon]
MKWFSAGSITRDVDVYVTAITSFELYYGAFYSKSVEESVKEVEIFLKNMRNIHPFTEKPSKIAGEIMAELRADQKLIEIRDLFIGAICIENDIPLLTRNISHFERIKGLRVMRDQQL